MRSLFFIAFFIGGYLNGFSQNITVTGKIKDTSGNVVAFANVLFTDVNDSKKVFGTLGNEDGSFIIELPKSKYNFEVSIVGLQSTGSLLDLKLIENEMNMGEVTINTNVALDEVVVTSNTSPYKIELDKKVYTVGDDITNNGGSLIDVMENVPSVQVEVDGTINIRGNGNVRILVDGRISGLTSTAAFLKTIPAAAIEKIEVITNPSSKYSSEGSGGIINVVLKKGEKKQLSSSFEIFTGVRLNSGYNINVNNRDEHWSWYINSGLGYSEPKATRELQINNFTAIPVESNQVSERILKQFYFLNNFGGALKINKKNTITADITYRITNLRNLNTIVYEDFNDIDLSALSERLNAERNKSNFLQLRTDYELKLNDAGSQITFNILAQTSKEDEASNILENGIFPEQVNLANDNSANKVNDRRYNLSVDYSHPFKNNSRLEFGFRTRFTVIENDFLVERINNNIASIIPEFTDETLYNENITSFYGQYAKSYSKFKFQLGLRTEISNIDVSSQNNEIKESINYTNIFPSGFFDYEFNENDKIRLSISRRIQRPRLNAIVPFSSFSDARNIFVGNPTVNPSYVILSELGYQTKFGNDFTLNPTLFYRRTNDLMDFFIQKETITINGQPQEVFVTRTVNIGNNDSYGFELGLSYKPLSWLNFYNEILVNGFTQKGVFQDSDLNSNGFSLRGRFHINFNIANSFKLQLQNRFRTGATRGQLTSQGIYRMDFGLSKALFNDNASLTVNFKDIFNTWKFRIKISDMDFTQRTVIQVRTPQLNVSFIYRLNQKKYQGKKGQQYDKL